MASSGSGSSAVDAVYKDDVKVTLAASGLYEWLLKIVSVNGVIGGDDGENGGIHTDVGDEDGKKAKDKEDKDKKQLLGKFTGNPAEFGSQHISKITR